MGLGAWGRRDCRGRRWMDGLELEMARMSVVGGVRKCHHLLRDSQRTSVSLRLFGMDA